MNYHNDKNETACNKHIDMRNDCTTWIGKSEGKASLAKTRHRWKGNSKLFLNKCCEGG